MRLLLLSICLAIFAACSSFPPKTVSLYSADPELAAIDSLMWTQPDSAFAQLQSFAESHDVDSLNDFNGHYFHLLLSELLYKNYCEQSNRNELLRAVDYYDSLLAEGGSHADADMVFLDARSHYIYGVGYYEMDSAVPACREYLRAVELMEERFSEEELTGERAQFMALTYTRLMDLYSNIYFHEQAVRFAKNALDFYEKIHASNRNIACMLDEIGAHFEMMEQLDSAAYYYERAFLVLSSDSVSITYRDLASRYAFFSYKNGNSFDSTMAWFRCLLAEAENEEERNARILSIGELFLLDGQLDSAFVWLERGYLGCVHIESKMQAAKWLKDLCDVTDHLDEKKEYVVFLSNKASTFDHQSELLSQLSDLYLSYSRHGVEIHRKLTSRKTWTILWIIVGLLLAMSAFVWYYVRHKHWAQSKKHEGVFSEQLEKGKKEQEKLTRELKNKELERINLYSELERYKTELIQKASNIEQLSDAYKSFRSEAICQSITFAIRQSDIKTGFKVTTYKEKALKPSDYRNYLAAVNKHARRFGEKLASCFPSLTRAETKMCYLLLLDLKDKELAVLLQISYQAVGKQMKSLLEKTGNTREGMVAYLISLAFA